MIESVMVEMCVSVIDVSPIKLVVVAVKRPAISWCLMNEVRLITNLPE
jgi:hypothetical protein